VPADASSATGGAGDFDPAAAGWRIEPDPGFIGHVGPLWVREAETGRRYAFVAQRKHANRRNRVQGGMLMTIADRVLGLAAWEAMGQKPCATVEFQSQFITGAKIGEFVEAQAEVVRCARSLVFMRGELWVGERLVMTATGLWKRLGP
jgi:acyl-coenzyme A thioesterase PaaI-like protein